LRDHYETYRPKLYSSNDPTVAGSEHGTYAANDGYKSIPGAVFRFGNLPAMINADVHSGEDVILTATGPGSERVRGQMENTEVFRVMVEALGLGAGPATEAQKMPGSPASR
jgi:alkaline phosphatase